MGRFGDDGFDSRILQGDPQGKRFDAILGSLTKVQVPQMIPFVPVSEPVRRLFTHEPTLPDDDTLALAFGERVGGGLETQQTYASEAETPWDTNLGGNRTSSGDKCSMLDEPRARAMEIQDSV